MRECVVSVTRSVDTIQEAVNGCRKGPLLSQHVTLLLPSKAVPDTHTLQCLFWCSYKLLNNRRNNNSDF